MRIITQDKSILVCDYCYPVPAIGKSSEGKDLCLVCLAIEGEI